jgi:hypothetical protein
MILFGQKRGSLKEWLVLGFGAALLSAALGFQALTGRGEVAWILLLVTASMLCSLFWLATFAASFFFIHWRGLWLLAAAPIALFPPYALGTILYSCTHGVCF